MAKMTYVGEPVGLAIGSSAHAASSVAMAQRPCRSERAAAQAIHSGSTGSPPATPAHETPSVTSAATAPAAPGHARHAVHAASSAATLEPAAFTSLVRYDVTSPASGSPATP